MEPPAKKPSFGEKEITATKKQSLEDKEITNDGKLCFDGFKIIKVLLNNPTSKRIHVHGKFKGSDDDAIVTLVKTPFSEDMVKNILTGTSSIKEEFNNDVYSQYSMHAKPEHNIISTQIIKPASEKHLIKYSDQKVYILNETADDYCKKTLPYLQKQKFSINWVYNILEHQTESERIVFEDTHPEKGFILLPDLKWDGKQLDDLYLVAICHRHHIKSIRDLNKEHLPMLKNILAKGLEAIQSKYDLTSDQIRVYLHYHPSYYHLHVHFNHVQYQVDGTSIGKAHFLADVIDNIENIDNDYYSKKTLTVTLRERDPLLPALLAS